MIVAIEGGIDEGVESLAVVVGAVGLEGGLLCKKT
jgi:hypothetical protein